MLSVSCRLLEREPDRINAILLATLRAGKRIPDRIEYNVYLFLDNYSSVYANDYSQTGNTTWLDRTPATRNRQPPACLRKLEIQFDRRRRFC